MATQIQLRRDTAANWTSTNPTMAQGEAGYETDTGKLKIGDGSTSWNSLAYQAAANIVDGTIVDADVNASAAIAGTKISPDFGSQALTTTGLISANGKVSFPLGTAALPSLYPGTDTNTGIYSPGADQVAISTNGTGRLFVDASGRVGVGTASPSQSLHVTGNAIIGGSPATQFGELTTVGTIAIQRTNPILHFVAADGSSRFGYLQHTGSTGNFYLLNQENGAIQFGTNNTERMRLDSSGRLGLGTSSPSYPLHVAGDAGIVNVHPFGYLGALQSAGGTGFRWSLKNDGTFFLQRTTDNFATGTTPILIDSAGNVGIGTTSPGAILHATSADDAKTAIIAGATNRIRTFGHLASFGGAVFEAVNNAESAFAPLLINGSRLSFGIGGSERARIDSSGRLGIGTASPGSYNASGDDLVIANTGANAGITVATGSSFASRIYFADGTTGSETLAGFIDYNHSTDSLAFGVNSAERARIDSSGRLLVGTSSALATRLASTAITPSFQVKEGGNGSALFFNGVNSVNPATLYSVKSRGTTYGTIVENNDFLFRISAAGDDGVQATEAARIDVAVDGTPGANDMPGRLVFSTTADGASSPTERLRITNAGVLQVADAGNIAVGTTTGTKIGTATTQKLGFYNATPVVQPTAVADATDAATAISQLNALLAHMRTLGLIAT